MRILNLKQFCSEPQGVVFSCYDGGNNYGELMVKTGYYKYQGKPTFNGIVHLTPNFDNDMDDGYSGEPSRSEVYYTNCFSTDTSEVDFESDQLFAVYSKEEIRRMINVLMYALCDGGIKLNTDEDDEVCY